MLPIRSHFPRQAIHRIPHQGSHVPPLMSCQGELFLRAPTYSALSTFLSSPGNVCQLIITDTHQILPYTTLTFQINLDSPSTTDTPYIGYLYLTPTENTTGAAAIFLAQQINDYANEFRLKHPDMASLHARAFDVATIIYLPWGMTGTPLATYTGPGGVESLFIGVPGVDHPLIYGLIAKRRHVFRVRFPFQDDYYGRAPLLD
jgi:hypothetical protein